MPVTTREKNTQTNIDEELRKARDSGRPPEKPKRSIVNAALGILEIAAGIAAIIVSLVAGALLAVLLGAIVLVSGILTGIIGLIQRSGTYIAIGALGLIAGIYILANPLTSLAILQMVIGIYLLLSGILNTYRARQSATSATGGLIEIIIGLVVLFTSFNIGFLAGLYLVIQGIITYNSRPKSIPR